MNVQLTTAQRLQQQLINNFITDLEKQIRGQQGLTTRDVASADLGNTLNGLFATFDTNRDSRFNANELTGLTGHLRQINTDQNIAQLFKADGQLNFATTSTIDITGNGRFNGQEDLVALQQIIGSRTLASPAAPGSGSNTITSNTSSNTRQILSGTGNVPGGLNNFNSRGAYFVTADGTTILTDVNVGGHTTQIYNRDGRMISRIWGDPHVEDDSGVGGDDWHFGNDSTFILPDGTEIMFNTEGNANNNVYITTGLYIRSGNDVYQTGQSFGTSGVGGTSTGARNAGISRLEISGTEFDAQYADAASDRNGAGVFAYSAQANSGRGGWAIMTDGGVFQDVKYEGWGTYLQAGRASFNGQYDGQVSVSREQMIAALDGDAVRSFRALSNSTAGSQIVAGSTPPRRADDLFLDYYFREGADTRELRAFSDMILNGSSAAKLSVLDDYIRNGADVTLTEPQEIKFLEYLVTPAVTPRIATAYLQLVENQADTKKFDLLDKLARGEYTMNASQQDTFVNFLLNSQNSKLAETYAGIIQNGGNQASTRFLEDYAAGRLNVTLNPAQENKMLEYLGGSANPNIAKSYLNLIQEGASARMLGILDDIFEGSGSLNQEVSTEDLRFADNLDVLRTQFNVVTDTSDVLENLSIANIDNLNQVVDRMLANNRNAAPSDAASIKTDTDSLYSNLISVLRNPLARIETNYSRTSSLEVLGDIFELQLSSLDTLEDSGQNVDAIRTFTQNRLNSLLDVDEPDAEDLATLISNLNLLDTLRISTGSRSFLGNINASNIDDVNQIINTMITTTQNSTDRYTSDADMYNLYSNLTSVLNNPLTPITNRYFSAASQNILGDIFELQLEALAALDPDNNDANVTATEVFTLDRLNSIPGRGRDDEDVDAPDAEYLATLINNLNLLDTLRISTGSRSFLGNINASNIDDVNQIINMMITTTQNSTDRYISDVDMYNLYSNLTSVLNNPLTPITNRYFSAASQNILGAILNLQLTTINDRSSNLGATPESPTFNVTIDGSYNTGDITRMQINVLEGMINLYENQITAENARPEPNASNLANWQTQITAHRSTVTTLQGTIS
jgi:hypothetical protein